MGSAAGASGVPEVEVVVAHAERATLKVGDVYLKVDADRARADVEVAAMALAPVPTPKVLWRTPPVLALAALPGTALGRLGEPSPAPASSWVAAGAAVRALGPGDPLHDLAILTLGHDEHLADVIHGYGRHVDVDVVRAWWSLRSLVAIPWLLEHGFDPFLPGCEVDVLRAAR